MAGMPRACSSEMLSLAEYSSAVQNPVGVRAAHRTRPRADVTVSLRRQQSLHSRIEHFSHRFS